MKHLLPLLPILALAACDNLAEQPRYDPYGEAALFADGRVMQVPPEGAVARDDPRWSKAYRERPPVTMALLARGRERYDIYCTPCHDASGYGHGTVPARGFPAPPSFHSQELRGAPSRHFFDVITKGYGVMYSYADRVVPADRWAIAAYIRALQLSQSAPVSALPAELRTDLEAGDAG